MIKKPSNSQIKVGRQGILVRGSRIPASFFRHQQPGKHFVVINTEHRRLMYILVKDLEAVRRAYRKYLAERKARS